MVSTSLLNKYNIPTSDVGLEYRRVVCPTTNAVGWAIFAGDVVFIRNFAADLRVQLVYWVTREEFDDQFKLYDDEVLVENGDGRMMELFLNLEPSRWDVHRQLLTGNHSRKGSLVYCLAHTTDPAFDPVIVWQAASNGYQSVLGHIGRVEVHGLAA